MIANAIKTLPRQVFVSGIIVHRGMVFCLAVIAVLFALQQTGLGMLDVRPTRG